LTFTGEILSSEQKIQAIKIPSVSLLHGLKNSTNENSFIEKPIKTNSFVIKLNSPLTSALYKNTESYLTFYKSNLEKLPIILVIEENGQTREEKIELTWEEVILDFIEGPNTVKSLRIDFGLILF